MQELLEKIKSIAITVLTLWLIIVVFTFFVFGAPEAANFVKWSFGIAKDTGDSGKAFIEEVKK